MIETEEEMKKIDKLVTWVQMLGYIPMNGGEEEVKRNKIIHQLLKMIEKYLDE